MNRLRTLREQHNMKQSELGKLLNVKEAAISKYETEKVLMTSDTLLELSKIFSVSIDYILGNDSFTQNSSSRVQLAPLDELDAEILKYFHQADAFDQVSVLRTLGIKKKISPLSKAK